LHDRVAMNWQELRRGHAQASEKMEASKAFSFCGRSPGIIITIIIIMNEYD